MRVQEIPALRNYWYPVAYSTDVTGTPHAARVLGTDLVVWRPAAGVAAALRHCPHRGADLSLGWVGDDCLVCPYHGWVFDPAGRCRSIPSAGTGTAIPPRAHNTAVGATERYGLVWVNLSDREREPMPELPEAEDPDYTVAHEVLEAWNAAAPQVIENGLDVSHVAFVHRNSVGTSAAPGFGENTVERSGLRLSFTIEHTARVTVQQRKGFDHTATVRRVTIGELVQPFVFRGVLLYPDSGLRHVLFKTATPIDDANTLFCQFIARNDHPDSEQLGAVVDLDRQVQAEDKVILERLADDYPLDITAQVHTKADRVTVEYRRILADLAAKV